MKEVTTQLSKIIEDYQAMMNSINEEKFSFKPGPQKWSKKEILGHIIDSAQNNIRRFIVSQYENTPTIVYNQDQWVEIGNYQKDLSKELIQLWVLLNKRICNILDNMPDDALLRTCATDGNKSHTIVFLAQDYLKHLLHHLHQVVELEPVGYP